MTYYWDRKFIKHITHDVKYVCEVGARYGDETIILSKTFPNASILSFECNPLTVEKCRSNLSSLRNARFFNFGLGMNEEILPFYSYIQDNDGASSFYKRIDENTTQRHTGDIKIKKLASVLKDEKIDYIDLLCMDVQGFELNVLKGAEDYLEKIKYVIMEEPKEVINEDYLPRNIHSKYLGSPSSREIKKFMNENGFIEIERLEENKIEDNVMYKNIRLN